MDEFYKEINFPYPSVRAGQGQFIKQVFRSIRDNKNILISAPTGLGKTVSGLAPALYLARKKGDSIIILTSRQTQANQIIKTIKDIDTQLKKNPKLKEKEKKVNYVAFIGKRNMCCNSNRDLYPAQDFNEFCKKAKEKGTCKYYKNTKNSDFAPQIKEVLEETSNSFMDIEGFVKMCASNNFCPYELAGKKAFKSDIIICDFNYLFAQGIAENFLGKIGRDLDECIVIVDEAHNLPDRIRSAYSHALTSEMIKNAQKEIHDFVKSSEFDSYINNLKLTLEEFYDEKLMGKEQTDTLISKDDFLVQYMKKFKSSIRYGDIIDKLVEIERLVKEDRIISHIGRIANFLEKWQTLDENDYLRVLEKNVKNNATILSLKIRCIDPSEISTNIVNNTKSTIFMSGTLSPINMYKDLLGVKNATTLELESPFARKNQLTLVINDVTTKYNQRSPDMFTDIANHIQNVLNSAHGKNAIIFFPSYVLLDKILDYLDTKELERKILKEKRYMTKEEKEKYVEQFKEENDHTTKATVLFAITSGSFAEGLDLPSKMLEVVVVVGLPLGIPDLFTNSVIRHFERKFRKGQMYGYIQPAMNKIIQAAGRCIRSEEDRGVVVLMDNRFLWPMYALTFPQHWRLHKSPNYKLEISNFFDEK